MVSNLKIHRRFYSHCQIINNLLHQTNVFLNGVCVQFFNQVNLGVLINASPTEG